MAKELDPDSYEQIKSLCEAGDLLASSGQFEAAVEKYNQAWSLVPEPKNEWNASTWIMAAVADACYLGGYKTSALETLRYAMTCPDAIGNPFLHMRLGQVLYDFGELDEAANELIRAYMGAGDDVFSDEDPKYMAFLRSRAKI